MLRFAKHIQAVDSRVQGLQLQKVMYYALGSYMDTHGVTALCKEVYETPMEAWDMGAIHRKVYKDEREGRLSANYDERLKVFDSYIRRYADKEVYELVDRSIDRGTYWWNYQEVICDRSQVVRYTLQDILTDFQIIHKNKNHS